MNIEEFEDLILKELKKVIQKILEDNSKPTISAKTRAGAEISNLLEKEFVKKTNNHKYFRNSASSPEGATKNPWDAMTYFCIDKHKELIWIDFKAVKVSNADSNPDIGTPDKVIKFIEKGHFYLVYVFVYYEETKTGLKFVKNKNNEMLKLYFLKDISHSFRRNPKNQLQVNISDPIEKRSREEFINLLFVKIVESHERQIKISKNALEKIESGSLKRQLLEINKKQEENIKKI